MALTTVLLATEALHFHVAPMQCYTNRHLRFLLRRLNEDVVLWTEMEKASDLLSSDEAMDRRLRHDEVEHPLVLQLGGGDAKELARATRLAVTRYLFDEVNLNCGCPSIETGGAAYGASLMRRPSHTRSLLEAVAEACDLPVSLKCRIAAHEGLNADSSLPTERYEDLHRFVEEVSSTGAISHVVVHARAAILSGLSPRANRCGQHMAFISSACFPCAVSSRASSRA